MKTRNMKAALIYGIGDIRIEYVEYPELDDESIILKVYRASICNGSDSAVYKGERDLQKAYPYLKLPVVAGHECSGEVVEVGKNITEFKKGDRVGFWCKPYGAFADYNRIYPNKLAVTKINDNISYDEGSLLEQVCSTMVRASEIEVGESVAIIGLGPAGQMLLQEVRLAGGYPVIGIDKIPFRLELAKRFGADDIVNILEKEVVTYIKEHYGLLDIVIDATGADVMDIGIDLLKKGGTFLIYGVTDSGVSYDAMEAFYKAIHICNPVPPLEKYREMIKRGEKLVSIGKLNLKELITHHFPLEELEAGIKLCRDELNKVMKVVIDIV